MGSSSWFPGSYFQVEISRYGIEGIVYLPEKENYKFDPQNRSLTSVKHQIKLFDKVKVEISVDSVKQQMNIICLDPPLHAKENEVEKRKLDSVQVENITKKKKTKKSKK
jgi:hypothetical protein